LRWLENWIDYVNQVPRSAGDLFANLLFRKSDFFAQEKSSAAADDFPP
jgi:hypothetical protein